MTKKNDNEAANMFVEFLAESKKPKSIEEMDFLSLRIPADMDQKITATTWTGEPPFQGSNGMYEQCNCKMIQIVPALYWDNREHTIYQDSQKVTLDGQLYCDEEGLLTGKQRNWRASQMRKWYFERYYEGQWDRNSEHALIVGDACFVVASTDENMKIMEAILDA
tara:strand:+ start:48 stop:542 length:495 start_codon:yes stop_codon:yes gene_type:complete